jgi:CRP-like cAMP-binding protein
LKSREPSEHNTEFTYTEEELVIFSHGQHFGEWGIIENKQRKASAIAIEDVDMFQLDKRFFDLTIGVFIVLILEVYD